MNHDFNINADQALPQRPLILCDCDGTLFGLKGGKVLNRELFFLLYTLKTTGHEVVIFSTSPYQSQKTLDVACNHLFKNPKIFGDVRSKADFAGQNAHIVFDDYHDSHTVNAQIRLAPEGPHIARMLGIPVPPKGPFVLT